MKTYLAENMGFNRCKNNCEARGLSHLVTNRAINNIPAHEWNQDYVRLDVHEIDGHPTKYELMPINMAGVNMLLAYSKEHPNHTVELIHAYELWDMVAVLDANTIHKVDNLQVKCQRATDKVIIHNLDTDDSIPISKDQLKKILSLFPVLLLFFCLPVLAQVPKPMPEKERQAFERLRAMADSMYQQGQLGVPRASDIPMPSYALPPAVQYEFSYPIPYPVRRQTTIITITPLYSSPYEKSIIIRRGGG